MQFKLSGNLFCAVLHKLCVVAELVEVMHPIALRGVLCALFNDFVRNAAHTFCMLGGAQFVARYEVTDIAAFENNIRLLD